MNLFGYSSENVPPVELIDLCLSEFSKSYKLDTTPQSEKNEVLQTMDFSEIDISLKKNLFKYPLCYCKFGSKYNNILSSARSLLCRNSLRVAFDRIISKINPQWTEACYLSWVKDFGTFLLEKVINWNYPIYLLNFVEIHMLSGYDTYLHRKFDIKKDVYPFTQRRILAPIYERIFKKHIRKTIDLMSFSQYLNCTFDDFVKYRDNWNLMGSATIGIPMKISTPGFRKATRIGSKTTNLLYYDDEKLLKELRTYKGHIIRPFLKTDEAAKSRVVIGYDTLSYIRCSFLETFIESFNGADKWTTVGDGPVPLFEIRDKVNDNIKTNKYQMVCTDQSAFDQHQYKSLFIYAFNVICERIIRLNPQVKEIQDLENYGMAHAKIVYPDGTTAEWKNGLLSGHKFTALIGSVLNRSATLTALELANIKLRFGVFQGDDALVFLDKDADYMKFLDAYSKIDLVVNPMKTWHGTSRTEYLHQVYIRDRVIALPMRAALGLFFKDPKSLEVAPDQYFNAQIDQFRMAQRRGLDVENKALSFVRKYLKKYSNLTHNDLVKESYNWLHTPTLYGGLGFENYVEKKYYRKQVVIKSQGRVKESEIISPYHYRIAGDPILTKKWILKKIYAHLPAPGIETTVRITRVNMKASNSIPRYQRVEQYFTYDPRLSDNSQRWLNHCRSLLNETCPFGNDVVSKFNKVRSAISDSFNLISNITNAFLGKSDAKFWDKICNNAIAIYSSCRISLNRVLSYVEYWRQQIVKNYRTSPPSWYQYGFFF
jgi:hypothetical protein